jgi:hypothetical protein
MKLSTEERKQIENEMLFRRANEKVGADLDALDAMHIADGNHHLVRDEDLLLDFKCECSDENCDARISMKLSDYKDVHKDRSSFVIKLHHEVKPIEKVIKTTENYSIVRKNNVTPEPELDAEFNKSGLDNSRV